MAKAVEATKPEDQPKPPTPDPNVAEPVLEDDEPRVHISFWQQKWVQNVLPFATSLAMHGGIIAAAFLGYQGVKIIKQVVQEQIIIPDATIVDGAEVGGIPNPGLGGDPTQAAAQNEVKEVTSSSGWSNTKSENLTQQLMGGGGSGQSESVIGIGGSGSAGGKGPGVGSGSGEGGGALAPFGVPGGGGGAGPKSPFMGISGNAKQVAYVCDGSGSMMNKMVSLKNELKKAIDVLRPIQAFNVIFFQSGDPETLSKGSLIMANIDNKRKAYTFLDSVSGAGETNPIPGLEMAFKQRPQLIYLLTDGDFPDNKAVLSTIRTLNKDKSVKINTIAFVSGADRNDPSTKSFTDLLKQIASENGGVFRFVSEGEM